MAGINLDAIKKKIEQLNSAKNAKVPFWKPDVGEYLIRIVPFNDTPDDDPFKHLEFYYNILERGGILCPKQFNKEDPVQELASKLWQGDADDKAAAKKLFPSTRHYITIIDRAEEDKGPQLWSFGKQVYLRLMEFFMKPGIGDYIDIEDGFDLEVSVKKESGAQFPKTTVDVARVKSPLSDDQKKVDSWLKGTLDPLDAYTQKSTEEIEKLLNDWLYGPSDEKEDGMEKGDTSGKSLDSAIESLKNDTDSEEDSEKPAKKAKKSRKAKTIDEIEESGKNLDKVFEDILDTKNSDE